MVYLVMGKQIVAVRAVKKACSEADVRSKSTPMTFDQVCDAGVTGDRMVRRSLQESSLNKTGIVFIAPWEVSLLEEWESSHGKTAPAPRKN